MRKRSFAAFIACTVAALHSNAQNVFPSTGNVGIGTGAPTQKLQVIGGNIQSDGAVYAGNWFRSFGTSGWYNENFGGGWFMADATWIRSYGSKNVYCDKVIRADGGFDVGGYTVIDAGGGWHRTYGTTGWYNGTYGGGWFMADDVWIRSYGSKNIYCDRTIRADGELQAGPNGDRFLVDGAGRVKIGAVSTPAGYKLFVEQGILTEKVKVAIKSTGNWSDYVFDKEYELQPLPKVEQYIIKNKHLPGIPSATQVVKEGLDLGEMNAKLLAKVEELTLYVIDIHKQAEAEKARNNRLEKAVQALQQQLQTQKNN